MGLLGLLGAPAARAASSASWWSCRSSVAWSPLPTVLISRTHSVMACMTLSAAVTSGLVMCLWVNCAVSVSRSAPVSFT